MHVTTESLEALAFMLPYLPAMPRMVDVDFQRGDEGQPIVSIQAHTQDEVRQVRQAFPGAILWVKSWNPHCAWLEYTASIDGITVHIWAVSEAPPACRIVEDEVTEWEDVPVTFEKQLVTRTVRRMECPEVSNG